ncbi:MAG: hypothetical protein K6B75_06135 [Lachnospiraceae bacterium]|nr:hypothetical protein [Lachnospiraceae bacterium]
MELYNAVIKKAEELLGSSAPKKYAYNSSKGWKENSNFELVMARDAAYELGGNGKTAVSFTCVTTSSELVNGDEILVYGPELAEIKEDSTYARITVIKVGDIESGDDDYADDFDDDFSASAAPVVENTEETFREIQAMDFTKYHVFPEGFMMRTSTEANREHVRISKEAIKGGISFEKIGNTFIKHYKENPKVLNVKQIFVTASDANYGELVKCAKNVHDITMTLTKILEGMPTDCSSCGLKPICDEVEGMRELHFGKKDINKD